MNHKASQGEINSLCREIVDLTGKRGRRFEDDLLDAMTTLRELGLDPVAEVARWKAENGR